MGNRDYQRETNGNGEELTTYGYDDLDRLETVTYPDQPAGSGHTVTYGYDGNYNRTSEETVNSTSGQTQKDRTYTYNARNQLTDISDHLDAANNVSYGFDANGNQISKTKAGATSDFIFDARDDLRQVMIGGSTVGQFLYDANGLRIEKQGERGTERYTYDGQSVLTQSDANNLTLAKYNYGPNRLLSLTHLTEGTQFYLFDALGSVTNLTSANGTLQARYQYDAWGNKRNETGSSWNRYGFTGHEEDKETGLIYAKARFYDPDTGRFLSQDAWEGDNTIAPSLHKYLYAYQNPTVYVDPDGNSPESAVAKQAATKQIVKRLSPVPIPPTGQELIESHNARLNLMDRAVDWVAGGLAGMASVYEERIAPKARLAAALLAGQSPVASAFVSVEDESGPTSTETPIHRPPAQPIPGYEIEEEALQAKPYIYEYADPLSAPPGYEPENLDNPVLGYPDQSGLMGYQPYLSESIEGDDKKRINVGESGHHVPSVRKSRGRPYAVSRSDKDRPTIHFTGEDPAHDHWRLHDAERAFVGPRQGDFDGSDQDLIDAYKKAYKGIDDIKVDVRSPSGKYNLGENLTPSEAVECIECYLKDKGKLK